MVQKTFMRISTVLAMLYCLFFLCGCFGPFDPIPFYAPDKVEGQPNTFEIPRMFFFPKAGKDQIQKITVEDRAEKVKVWEIRATCDIPTLNFKVTVGEIPKGFEQMIPGPTEKFVPVSGRQYTIYIHTKFADDPKYSPHIMPQNWIAEPSVN